MLCADIANLFWIGPEDVRPSDIAEDELPDVPYECSDMSRYDDERRGRDLCA